MGPLTTHHWSPLPKGAEDMRSNTHVALRGTGTRVGEKLHAVGKRQKRWGTQWENECLAPARKEPRVTSHKTRVCAQWNQAEQTLNRPAAGFPHRQCSPVLFRLPPYLQHRQTKLLLAQCKPKTLCDVAQTTNEKVFLTSLLSTRDIHRRAHPASSTTTMRNTL